MSVGTDFYDLFKKQEPLRALPANVTPIDPARATRYAAKALISECENVAAAAVGTRNHTLNRAAFSISQLVAAGHLEHTDAWTALTEAARAAGLDEGEIEPTIASGFNAGTQSPRVVPELPDLPEPTILEVPDLTPAEDDAFWESRDLLVHIHQFARARRVSPWAVLGVVMARVVTATSHQVCLPAIIAGRASLNLFVGLVGPSGAGKGGAESVAVDCLHVGPIVSHNVGSGEGIAHGFKHRIKGELVWNDEDHAVLFSIPEIDSLAAQGDRRGATLMPQLRSAWSGESLGFGYADPMKRIIIERHQYRLCIVAGIQPTRAGFLLDDSEGGTPQRFLWLPATDPDAPDTPPAEPAPRTWEPPRVSEIVSITGAQMKVTDLAVTTIQEAAVARLRGAVDALDGHALLARLKVAAALALLERRLTITDEDWEIAETVMRKSNSVRSQVVAALGAKAKQINEAKGVAEANRAVLVDEAKEDAAIRRACNNIMRRLRREDDWMPRGKLRADALTGKDRGNFEVAVSRLLEAGQIIAEEGSKGARFRVSQ